MGILDDIKSHENFRRADIVGIEQANDRIYVLKDRQSTANCLVPRTEWDDRVASNTKAGAGPARVVLARLVPARTPSA